MKVITYEGVVENGHVQLPADVILPENAIVYVVVPGTYDADTPRVSHVYSPRLVHPEQAKDFVKVVVNIEESTDAGL
jgi:hypothetical protein